MDERQSTGDGLKNVGDVCGLVSITACLGDAARRGHNCCDDTQPSQFFKPPRRPQPASSGARVQRLGPVPAALRCSENRRSSGRALQCTGNTIIICVWAGVLGRALCAFGHRDAGPPGGSGVARIRNPAVGPS